MSDIIDSIAHLIDGQTLRELDHRLAQGKAATWAKQDLHAALWVTRRELALRKEIFRDILEELSPEWAAQILEKVDQTTRDLLEIVPESCPSCGRRTRQEERRCLYCSWRIPRCDDPLLR